MFLDQQSPVLRAWAASQSPRTRSACRQAVKAITCPKGKITSWWASPPSLAPYITASFTVADCRDCPVNSSCTRTDARTVAFLPRDLYDIQSESRTEQHTQEWLSRYSLRAAIESTISESVTVTACASAATGAKGPRPARPDRHRGQSRTHRCPLAAGTRPAAQESNRTPRIPRLAAHPPAPVPARRHPSRRLK
ncbi:transposase [Streptomyces sp. NPDC001068]|uniref:transposase n=1 Tax=Streptomyces sp. NPDC001068 TaxID=3364544 RepID=UPI0036C5E219